MDKKLDKLLSEVKVVFEAQEHRNKTAEEYKQVAKKYVVECFTNNLLYWLDGYDKIFEECGIIDPELKSKLLGKIRQHQENGISRWVDYEGDK